MSEDPLLRKVRELALELSGLSGEEPEFVDFLEKHGIANYLLSKDGLLARTRGIQLVAKSLSLRDSLKSLGQLFRENDMPYLSLKGAALSQLCYGSPLIRQFGDLDVLVEPHQAARACELLRGAGFVDYRPKGLVPPQAAAHYKYGKAITFERGSLIVDLHWKLYSHWLCLSVDHAEIWNRSQTVCLADKRATPTLGLEDTLLFLVFHGSQDGWEKLKGLTDLAAFLYRHTNLDYNYCVIASGVRLPLFETGLSLAHLLLEAPLPPETRIRFGSRSEAITYLKGCMELGPPKHKLLRARYFEGSWYKVLALRVRALLTPSVDDISATIHSRPEFYLASRVRNLIVKSWRRERA